MSFVSNKEPLTLETLPDTSLHNVRARYKDSCFSRDASSSSTSSTSDFFSSPDARVPKLTKEHLDVYKEFITLGTTLMAENADLFFESLKLLSDKYKLKVATPASSISDIIPLSRGTRRRRAEGVVAPRAQTRKYVVPKEYADKEYYKCMVCNEQRSANSFGAAHAHEGSAGPYIRWHCPFCDKFFAVTHRGNHLSNCHKILPQTEEKQPAACSCSASGHSEGLKRPRDETCNSDESKREPAQSGLPEKVWACDILSPVSPASSTTQSYSPSSETREEGNSVDILSPFSFDQEQQPLFPSFLADEQQSFPLFPSQSEEEDILFASKY